MKTKLLPLIAICLMAFANPSYGQTKLPSLDELVNKLSGSGIYIYPVIDLLASVKT